MRTSRKLFIWAAVLAAVWLIPTVANYSLASFYTGGDPALVVTLLQVMSLVQVPIITVAGALAGAGFVIDYLERRPRDPIAEPVRILPEKH